MTALFWAREHLNYFTHLASTPLTLSTYKVAQLIAKFRLHTVCLFVVELKLKSLEEEVAVCFRHASWSFQG